MKRMSAVFLAILLFLISIMSPVLQHAEAGEFHFDTLLQDGRNSLGPINDLPVKSPILLQNMI